MIKKFILISVIFVLSIFVFPKGFAEAATYYACNNANTCGSGWVTGNDANSCNSKSTACGTIRAGILKMLGGDELVIGDGTYTGTSNSIYNIPSGSAGKYTIIRAENDWGTIVTAKSPSYPTPSAYINNNQYIEIRGIKFLGTNGLKLYVINSDHIKIIRCSSDGVVEGNGSSFAVAGSSYVLFEECFSYGAGRYPFGVTKNYSTDAPSHHIIFRRNVCRWDYSNTIEPQACFANYDQEYVYYQNNVVVDGKEIRGIDAPYDGAKGFFTPNGAKETHFQGNIVLNFEGTGYRIEQSPVSNVTLTDSIAWNTKWTTNDVTYPANLFYSDDGIGPLTVNRATLGDNDLTNYGGSDISNITLRAASSTIKNSIIYGNAPKGIYGYAVRVHNNGISQYNSYYNNTPGKDNYNGIGATSFNNINPLNNGLKYLPRIEDNSFLKTAGENGLQVGAQIVKRYGASGTLWGEAGWDVLTNDDLWPFPNEDVIKKDVASFYKSPNEVYAGSPEMIGARGFAADGNGLYGNPITLTSYIWEYLGNPCPADICNYTQTFSPADTNQNGKIEMKELVAFIGRWKTNQAVLSDVLDAMGRWLRGE